MNKKHEFFEERYFIYVSKIRIKDKNLQDFSNVGKSTFKNYKVLLIPKIIFEFNNYL